MAAYPKQLVEKFDATATTEAWPLIGLFILDIAVMAAALYVVGEIANSLL